MNLSRTYSIDNNYAAMSLTVDKMVSVKTSTKPAKLVFKGNYFAFSKSYKQQKKGIFINKTCASSYAVTFFVALEKDLFLILKINVKIVFTTKRPLQRYTFKRKTPISSFIDHQ